MPHVYAGRTVVPRVVERGRGHLLVTAVLPHPKVAEYERRRAGDRDRWLAGMRRVRAETDQPYDLDAWRLLVETGCLGLAVAPEHGGSGDLQATAVSFASLPSGPLVPGVAVSAADGTLTGTVSSVADALLASEQLGVARWCLDTAVDYVGTRRQFGRVVGSFQAVKHRLADMWVDQTQATAVARYAARRLADADPDLPLAAALAQAHGSTVAVKAAEDCLRLHGGIGFAWEHPTHLCLKRAKSSSLAFGAPSRHREVVAALVDLPAAPVG